MTTHNGLKDRIAKLFVESTNIHVPKGDTDLFVSGALDSLSFVGLLARLEQEFEIQISIDDIDIDNFRCLDRIADFVASRTEAAASV